MPALPIRPGDSILSSRARGHSAFPRTAELNLVGVLKKQNVPSRLRGLVQGRQRMSSENCPFCHLGPRIVAENDLAAALRDKEPASKGHTLVVPKRHCKSFFDLTAAEVAACSGASGRP